MSRNEVEIDLSKFMEMVTENNELKQKIWELEHDDKVNPCRNMDISCKDRGFLENIQDILECLHILNLLRCYVVLRIGNTHNGTVRSY